MLSRLRVTRQTRSMTRSAHSLPAAFYRGGTSKAVFFQRKDLPADHDEQAVIFRSAIGSPDTNGRQLNGMGGGLSSVSKVLVVDRSERDDADVEYTFVQVGVKDGLIDTGSNCGNMLAAVGPYAIDEKLAPLPKPGAPKANVRIFNTNTNKVIHSTFPVNQDGAVYRGDFAIDGVSGTAAKIELNFIQPGGSRTGKYLPTGNVVDQLSASTVTGYDGPEITVSLVDCGNPCVFVAADALDKFDSNILPPDLENDKETLRRLEQIRRASLVKMGLATDMEAAGKVRSVPKVCIVSPYDQHKLLSGDQSTKADITVRCISSGDPHRALPVTAALCMAAAAQTTGTTVNTLLGKSASEIVISHPTGTIMVGAEVRQDGDRWDVAKAKSMSTARKLFEGRVFV